MQMGWWSCGMYAKWQNMQLSMLVHILQTDVLLIGVALLWPLLVMTVGSNGTTFSVFLFQSSEILHSLRIVNRIHVMIFASWWICILYITLYSIYSKTISGSHPLATTVYLCSAGSCNQSWHQIHVFVLKFSNWRRGGATKWITGPWGCGSSSGFWSKCPVHGVRWLWQYFPSLGWSICRRCRQQHPLLLRFLLF